MKKDLSITLALQKAVTTVSRYQILLFFVIVSSLVVIAIVMVLKIFNETPQTTTQAPTQLISEENKATVEKLSELRSSNSLEDIPEPDGRFSPFFESEWNSAIMER